MNIAPPPHPPWAQKTTTRMPLQVDNVLTFYPLFFCCRKEKENGDATCKYKTRKNYSYASHIL